MANKEDYIFQTSWEVCNKVGGIYTVLSTVAASLEKTYADRLIYIGPDFHIENNPLFSEDTALYADWKKQAETEGLNVRIGRWNVPGNPVVVLVDFYALEDKKNDFLFRLWQSYGVDSMNMGQDYENSVLFSYAAGRVVESFGGFYKINPAKTVAHFHEWQTAAGLLYIKMNNLPYKTAFTTHATTVGRSICFNNKLLYQYFNNYNGDQMAGELGVRAQHAIEKNGAHLADCFTTVSKLTARECTQLLEKTPDVVTPNGFEAGFVPKGAKFTSARKAARETLKTVSETLLGYKLEDDALFVGISGRLEFRNKGIDVFIEAMKSLNQNTDLKKQIVAFIIVPDWNDGAREDLRERLDGKGDRKYHFADVVTTHKLHQPQYDSVMQSINYFQFQNNENDRVKIFFAPHYLDGFDGIFNKVYYDMLIGLDLTVFPSYYEPWGYTPMESAAFCVPTITTDLTGFGLWVSDKKEPITNGVAVLHRDDSNRQEVVDGICKEIIDFASLSKSEVDECRKKAKAIADDGEWEDFVVYYHQAYAFAKGEKYVAKPAEKKVSKPAEKKPKATAAKAAKTAKKDDVKVSKKNEAKTATKKTTKKDNK